MTPSYDELRGGSPTRMVALRAEARRIAGMPHRRDDEPPTWRDVRYRTLDYAFPEACMGRNDDGPVITTMPDADALPVRRVKFADEVADVRIRHRGWFTDEHGDETARGIVGYLPRGRFLAGYVWSSNDEHVLYVGEIFDDERDAARAADRHAEHFADAQREDSARFDRMTLAETAVEDAAEAVRDALALRRQQRRSTDDVREALDELREAREELAEATAAYERGE